MTKSHQEIAREAAKEILNDGGRGISSSSVLWISDIILAAIEKAYHEGANDMDKNYRERERLDADAQPQHSEPEYNLTSDEFKRRQSQPIDPPCTCLQNFGCDTECPVHGSIEQPQGWTPEHVKEILSRKPTRLGAFRVSYAHNAALAAEREWWEKASLEAQDYFNKELSSEREKVEDLEAKLLRLLAARKSNQ